MELAVQKEALGYPNCPLWSPRAARSCSQNPQDQPGELAAGGKQGTVYLAASPPLALVKTDLLKAFSPKHTLPGSQQVGERQQQTQPHTGGWGGVRGSEGVGHSAWSSARGR